MVAMIKNQSYHWHHCLYRILVMKLYNDWLDAALMQLKAVRGSCYEKGNSKCAYRYWDQVKVININKINFDRYVFDVCVILFTGDSERASELRTACLAELKKPPALFSLAHRLVDKYPQSATSWFAVGCYYYIIGIV